MQSKESNKILLKLSGMSKDLHCGNTNKLKFDRAILSSNTRKNFEEIPFKQSARRLPYKNPRFFCAKNI